LLRLLGLPSHVYWEQEGNYLIVSNIPQTLIDRHYIQTKKSVKDWLEKQQRINSEGSLMMFSLRNQGIAEKMYRMHLSALNSLADFAGKPIDLFALATPREANIPKQSSYGFKITSSDTQLGFELNYESNPFEFLFAGGAYQGVAVLGILSSVALPAYENYRVKTKILPGILDVSKTKADLNEFEIEYGRYPNQYEIEDLTLEKDMPNYSLKVEENTGIIHLKYKKGILKYNDSLKMIPPKQGVSTRWRCQTRIKKRYLTASSGCR